LNPGNFGGSTLSYVKNRVCLSHGVQMTGVTLWAATNIVTGVGDLMQGVGDDQAQVRYSVAGRSRCRVTLCPVCIMYKEMRSAGFLV
jgi:hypothetical protein